MEAARQEMKGRIKTLERSIERSVTLRDDLLAQVAEYDQQIEQNKTLIADYGEVLQRLNGLKLDSGRIRDLSEAHRRHLANRDREAGA